MPAGACNCRAFDPLVLWQSVEGLPCPRARLYFQDARDCIDLVARFDYVAVPFFVEAAMHRSVKSAGDDFSDIALWQQDVVWVIAARSLPADLDLLQVWQDRLVKV